MFGAYILHYLIELQSLEIGEKKTCVLCQEQKSLASAVAH